MSHVRKNLVEVFFIFLLHGLVCSLIISSQATDFLDEEDAPALQVPRRSINIPQEAMEDTTHHIISPIPGILKEIFVNTGQQVEIGDALCVLEAMKMEFQVRSVISGQIHSIFFKVGDLVNAHSPLIRLLLSPPEGEDINQTQTLPNEAVSSSNKDEDNQNQQMPLAPPLSFLWLLRGNLIPQLASPALTMVSSCSGSSPVFPGVTNSFSGTPDHISPDNGRKFSENSAQSIQRDGAGIRLQPSISSFQMQEAIVSYPKIENFSLKKSNEEKIEDSLQRESSFSQSNKLTSEELIHKIKPALDYSILTHAKGISGLMILGALILAIMSYHKLRQARPGACHQLSAFGLQMAVFCASVSQIRLNVFCDTVLQTHHFRHKILQLMTRPRRFNDIIPILSNIRYLHALDFNKTSFIRKQSAPNMNRRYDLKSKAV